MRCIAAILIWFLSMSQVWADEGAPADTTKSLIIDALSQAQLLADYCPFVKVNETRMTEVLKNAGIKRSDLFRLGDQIEDSNSYKGPVTYGASFATEIQADMSIKGVCYHLKVRFGPEGETITNLVIPTKP